MARTLTTEQRERANQRKRDARAAKKTGQLKSIESIDFENAKVEIVNADPDEFTAENLAYVPGMLNRFLDKEGIVLSEAQLESLVATLTETKFPYDPFSVGMIAEAIVLRDEVRAAKVGDSVVTPRGGMRGVVIHRYRDGGIVVTGDGGNKEGGACSHQDPENGVYWEVIDGQWAGQHGWLHRARGCNRTFQWG